MTQQSLDWRGPYAIMMGASDAGQCSSGAMYIIEDAGTWKWLNVVRNGRGSGDTETNENLPSPRSRGIVQCKVEKSVVTFT
jgi:hypothetical protein